MSISPETWLVLTTKIIPPGRADWLAGMKAELAQISIPSERHAFAFGCFKAALLESAKSRKGLSVIARVGVASFIFAVSVAAWVLWVGRLEAQPEVFAISKVIIPICLAYMCGAVLLLTSLKGLKFFAVSGFSLATLSAFYCSFAQPVYTDLSLKFLTVLSVEVAAIMAGLLFFAVYLTWLYDPNIHDV